MDKFDAAAATAAYLATLSPAAHAKATAYTQGGHWVLLWGTVISIVISVIILRLGVVQKISTNLRNGALAVLAVVPVLNVMEFGLGLPWASYSEWWREKGYGLTSQPYTGWLGEQLLGAAIGIVLSMVAFSLLYWLIRRAPKTWWLWSGGMSALLVIVGLLFLVPVIEPIFNKFTPAPAGPVRDTVVAMAKQVGVPSDKIFIYDGSKQSNRYTANVSGLFGSARVAMSDVMFKKDADMAEVKGVVGHEMGHYVHMHSLWQVAITALLAIVGFFLVDRLFNPVVRLTGAKGIKGISDPAGLPIFGIILSVLGLLATPVTNTMIRTMESDADNFSVVNFHEPDGLAKALVKTIEYRASSPSAIEEFIFYDHPSVERRVRAMMDWKAANQPAAPAPVAPAPVAPAPAAAPVADPEAKSGRTDTSNVSSVAAPKSSAMETAPSNISVGEIEFGPPPKKK